MTQTVWVRPFAFAAAILFLFSWVFPIGAGGKVARAAAVSPLIEAGNVYLPHPNGAHDDQVDARTQALLRWNLVLNQQVVHYYEPYQISRFDRRAYALPGMGAGTVGRNDRRNDRVLLERFILVQLCGSWYTQSGSLAELWDWRCYDRHFHDGLGSFFLVCFRHYAAARRDAYEARCREHGC